MAAAAGATPPLITQLKQTLRHSTPIGGFCHRDAFLTHVRQHLMPRFTAFSFLLYAEIACFSEKSDVADVSAEVALAASDVAPSEDEAAEQGDKKLSLRMKLVTPVEEGSSERFSLQSESCFSAVLSNRLELISRPCQTATFYTTCANLGTF